MTTVWLVRGDIFIAVFDSKPTPHDLKELARDVGFPDIKVIDGWSVEAHAVRKGTAIGKG